MAVTLAVVALLLVLLALPRFFDDHRPELWFPLILAALVLAGVMVAALPLALAHGSSRVRAGYWVPIAAYVGLLLIEPFTLRERLPEGSTPWLLGLSLIAFSCTVLVVTDPVRSAAICTGIDVALACVYADRFPLSHTLITSIGLLLLAVGLIAGVRALRARADQADAAELQAQLLFERQQHQVATEAERVRTDALLHDTVLAAFLAAAGNHVPEQIGRAHV